MSQPTKPKCPGSGVHSPEMVVMYESKHGPRYMCTFHAEQHDAGKTR